MRNLYSFGIAFHFTRAQFKWHRIIVLTSFGYGEIYTYKHGHITCSCTHMSGARNAMLGNDKPHETFSNTFKRLAIWLQELQDIVRVIPVARTQIIWIVNVKQCVRNRPDSRPMRNIYIEWFHIFWHY